MSTCVPAREGRGGGRGLLSCEPPATPETLLTLLSGALPCRHCVTVTSVSSQPHSSGPARDAGRAQTGRAWCSSLSSAGQDPYVGHTRWATRRSPGPAAPGGQDSPRLPSSPEGGVCIHGWPSEHPGQLRRPPAPPPSVSKSLQRWGPCGTSSGLPRRGPVSRRPLPGAYPQLDAQRTEARGRATEMHASRPRRPGSASDRGPVACWGAHAQHRARRPSRANPCPPPGTGPGGARRSRGSRAPPACGSRQARWGLGGKHHPGPKSALPQHAASAHVAPGDHRGECDSSTGAFGHVPSGRGLPAGGGP